MRLAIEGVSVQAHAFQNAFPKHRLHYNGLGSVHAPIEQRHQDDVRATGSAAGDSDHNRIILTELQLVCQCLKSGRSGETQDAARQPLQESAARYCNCKKEAADKAPVSPSGRQTRRPRCIQATTGTTDGVVSLWAAEGALPSAQIGFGQGRGTVRSWTADSRHLDCGDEDGKQHNGMDVVACQCRDAREEFADNLQGHHLSPSPPSPVSYPQTPSSSSRPALEFDSNCDQPQELSRVESIRPT
ncbi:hypothetical protein EDB85DRAFT_2274936 [Lactarius pseudohatsudake]|nr:hypothetical protein EDB85DRAFT_2274936 [Lactarius pseudohatsudake]